MNARDLTPLKKAELAWGSPLPDWVEALALAANQSSISSVAKQLGLSITMISQGINNKYGRDGKGNIETLISAVRTHLMHEKIDCPALGMILKADCQEWRHLKDRPAGSNPARATMARSCRQCFHFRERKEQ